LIPFTVPNSPLNTLGVILLKQLAIDKRMVLCLWFLYQDKVLKPLGAVTTGSQFLEPDGNSLLLSSCNCLSPISYTPHI
jgi:hypothetical protein